MSSTASWWVKLARADKHLRELKRELRRYAESRPYEPTAVVESDDDSHMVATSLRITRQPDPTVAAVIGDVVHNVRSALDHIAVALAPRKRSRDAAFPIVTDDIWLIDATGKLADHHCKARDDYARRVKGMDARAQAIINAAQPLHDGGEADAHILAVINSLDNADKHRSLIVTASVISAGWVSYHIGGVASGGVGFHGQHEDRTQVQTLTIARRPAGRVIPWEQVDEDTRRWIESVPYGKVNVNGRATITVSVRSRLAERGHKDAVATLETAIHHVSKIIEELEPFVRTGVPPEA